MNKKRAQGLSLNYVIIAVIGLIVFIIIIAIFRGHVGRSSRGYKDITDQAIESAQGNNCEAPIFATSRKCHAVNPGPEWEPVPGEWADCKAKNEECYRLTGPPKPKEEETS